MTLVEQAAIAVIIGVLGAISTPSFLGMYNNTKLKNATNNLYYSLIEAQKQAQRKGQKCTLTLPKMSPVKTSTINGSPAGCLTSSYSEISQGIMLKTDLKNIRFSFRGLPTETGTIIVSFPQGSNQERCVEIVDNLGLIKQGIYQNSSCQLLP